MSLGRVIDPFRLYRAHILSAIRSNQIYIDIFKDR